MKKVGTIEIIGVRVRVYEKVRLDVLVFFEILSTEETYSVYLKSSLNLYDLFLYFRESTESFDKHLRLAALHKIIALIFLG